MTSNDRVDSSSPPSEAIEPEPGTTDAAIVDAEVSAPSNLPDSPPATIALRARIRWAGIVWGLVLAAVAAAGIQLASAPGRTDDLVAWAQEIAPATAIGYGVVAIGVLLLVTGVVGLLRRAQRSLAARRAD